MHFELTAGQLHDISSISQTIKHIPPKAVFIADKAFDCNSLIESLIAKDVQVVIPAKKNRTTPRTHERDIFWKIKTVSSHCL